MSFSVYNLRKYVGDSRQKIQDVINKWKEKQNQTQSTDPDSDETESTIGAVAINYLKYYDTDLQLVKTFTVTAQSGYVQLCLEPDGNLLKCWLTMRKPWAHMYDQSGFKNQARFRGVPRISQGIDINNLPTIETVFDGSSNYIEIIDDPSDSTNLPNPGIQFSDATTGFTFCLRFKPYAVTRTGWHIPLLYKFDYTSSNWLWMFIDGVTSKLTVYVKRSGTFYSTIYNTALVANVRHEITFSFDSATPANRKLYVDGVDRTTLNSPTEPEPPWIDNLNMMLGRSYPLVDALPNSKYPQPDVSKLYAGTMQDFRWWKQKVASSTEAIALYNNKCTFYNLASRAAFMPNSAFIKT